MKIVLITNYWKGSDGGGIRNYSTNLVRCFKKKGHRVNVIFRKGHDLGNYQLSNNKIIFLLKAFILIFSIQPEVVICQGGWFTFLPVIFFKIIKNQTRIYILFHTHTDKKIMYIKKHLYQAIFIFFNGIGFVSKGLMKNIQEVGNIKIPLKKKTFILYAGIKIKRVPKNEIKKFMEKYKITGNDIVLCGLGLTALPAKKEGVKILLRVLRNLVDEIPTLKLILTRKGRYTIELKEYCNKIGLNKHVIFTGDIANPLVPLTLSNIYVHITLEEGGVSLAILEAMSLRKPVIASEVGGIPEIIKHQYNGLLVQNHEDDITKKIKMLIKNKKQRERIEKNAFYTVINNFKWEKTINKFILIDRRFKNK